MVGASGWMTATLDILVFLVIVFFLLFLKAVLDNKRVAGKMAIDIREPTGFTERHIVKPDVTGDTVTYDNCVYALTKSASADVTKKNEHYPRVRFCRYPKNPFLGLSIFQTTLRIEEYQRGNPEPIHPFYGRVDEKGMFIDSQLTVTGTEWQSQKGVIQATAIAMSVQEREAREKEWQKAMANIPNAMLMYIGLGISALCSIVSAVIIYQVAQIVSK